MQPKGKEWGEKERRELETLYRVYPTIMRLLNPVFIPGKLIIPCYLLACRLKLETYWQLDKEEHGQFPSGKQVLSVFISHASHAQCTAGSQSSG